MQRLEELVGVPTLQGFEDCRPGHCGLVRCSAGCWFALRRRWLNGVLSVHKLFCTLPGPLFEVRMIRAAWHRPLGKLNTMNMQSAKQFVRQRLDTRGGRQAIMIGCYKVSKDRNKDRWIGEICAVVNGLDEFGLRRAFRLPYTEGYNDHVDVIEVDDLPTTLVEALRPDVRVWQPPRAAEPIEVPAKRERTEFYRWILRLKPDERLFRYGCDQYFKPIVKEPRRLVINPKKKRPGAYWLEPHRYGEHDSQCTCRVCQKRQNQ
jgi:hypothetical protein